MKLKASALVLGLAVSGGFVHAAEPDLSKLPPAADRTGVTYEKDIRPIFEASCFRCHGEERPRNGLRLDSLQAVLEGSDDGKVVVPGDGKKSLLLIAAAQLDPETAMPPKRRPGGPGGQGPGMMLARAMMSQGDNDADKTLSKVEFTALADAWFDKMDSTGAGKLSREQFMQKFPQVVGRPGGPARGPDGRGPGPQGPPPGPDGGGPGGPPPGGPGGRGGPRPGGPGGFNPASAIAPAFFDAADPDQDNSLTRAEFKQAFAKWFDQWDSQKHGTLTQDDLRKGLDSVLPRPRFGGAGQGGPGGPGGPGGFGGPGPNGRGPGAPDGGPRPDGPPPGGPDGPSGFGGPGGPGGGFGPPPKPLTADQVSLVRAWIDQGAK